MSDLISRQAALDAIQQRADRIDSVYSAFWEGLIIAHDTVRNVPSAEPERTAKVEVVEKPNVFKCSECGQYFHRTSWGSPVLYCSRCGVRLEWE